MTTTPPDNTPGTASEFGWNLNQTLNQLLSFVVFAALSTGLSLLAR